MTYPHMAAEDDLHALVAKLKADGVEPVERAGLTEDARRQVLLARSDAFASGTQGKGKPMKYGTGKREAPK